MKRTVSTKSWRSFPFEMNLNQTCHKVLSCYLLYRRKNSRISSSMKAEKVLSLSCFSTMHDTNWRARMNRCISGCWAIHFYYALYYPPVCRIQPPKQVFIKLIDNRFNVVIKVNVVLLYVQQWSTNLTH